MKISPFISIVLIALLHITSGCTGEENAAQAEKTTLEEPEDVIVIAGKPILDQTFEAELPDFGDVSFAPYASYEEGPGKLLFYLLKEDKPIYQFPDFHGNMWSFETLDGVAFLDVNMDNGKDIIIVSEYITGIGPEGVVPFSVVGIYITDMKDTLRKKI